MVGKGKKEIWKICKTWGALIRKERDKKINDIELKLEKFYEERDRGIDRMESIANLEQTLKALKKQSWEGGQG